MNEKCSRDVEFYGNSAWTKDKGIAQAQRASEKLPCPVTKNMKGIFEEFKSLYEERLRRLQCGTEDYTKEMMQVGAIKGIDSDTCPPSDFYLLRSP